MPPRWHPKDASPVCFLRAAGGLFLYQQRDRHAPSPDRTPDDLLHRLHRGQLGSLASISTGSARSFPHRSSLLREDASHRIPQDLLWPTFPEDLPDNIWFRWPPHARACERSDTRSGLVQGVSGSLRPDSGPLQTLQGDCCHLPGPFSCRSQCPYR